MATTAFDPRRLHGLMKKSKLRSLLLKVKYV